MSALLASLSVDVPSHIPNPNLNPTTTLPEDASHNVLTILASDPVALSRQQQGHSQSDVSPLRLYTVTPLVYSPKLSSIAGHNIYLKLDCLQPSASFKMRGISTSILAAHARTGSGSGSAQTHIIISSGGNAGLAAATACKALPGVRCTVFVPTTTEEEVIATLRGLEAEVRVGGRDWNEADEAARILVREDENASYIHAFEGDDLIRGHSSLSKEIHDQFPEAREKAGLFDADGSCDLPDVIVCSTGGGGLIHGILRGITDVQSAKPANSCFRPLVVSCQDDGANSLNASYDRYLSTASYSHEQTAEPYADKIEPITLGAITSKATSMGTKRCGADNLAAVIEYSRGGTLGPAPSSSNEQDRRTIRGKYVRTLTLDDSLSGSAAWQFYRDHSMIVEMACGASLAPIYSPALLSALLDQFGASETTNSVGETSGSEKRSKKNVVVVVCGGSKTSVGILEGYKETYGEMKGRATVDGVEIMIG